MADNGKRAPGGGMKPKGPYAGNEAMITARIEPDLRARLDRAAKIQFIFTPDSSL